MKFLLSLSLAFKGECGITKEGGRRNRRRGALGEKQGRHFSQPTFSRNRKKEGEEKKKETKETSSVPCRVFAIFFTLAAVAVVASFQNIQVTFREGKQFPP